MKTPRQKARNAVYMREWAASHREESRARARRYWLANKEKCAAAMRVYAAAHPEVARASFERWYAKNKAVQRLRAKMWRKDNLERARLLERAWAKAHPEVGRSCANRRRARKIGSASLHTAAEWIVLCWASGWRCAYCKCALDETTVTRDHKTPLSRGGTDGIENIALACGPCNCRKWTYTAEEFLARIAA